MLFEAERAQGRLAAAITTERTKVAAEVRSSLVKQHEAAVAASATAAKRDALRDTKVRVIRRDIVKYVPSSEACALPPEVIDAINKAGH